ncbi:MAG: hypothetical protein FD155_3351, partial [Bacteroidetes bacterium]
NVTAFGIVGQPWGRQQKDRASPVTPVSLWALAGKGRGFLLPGAL